MKEEETWEKIKEYPRYSVSSYGRIRNDISGRIRKQTVSKKGYLRVGLQPSKYPNHPQPDICIVSRIVAKAFIQNPNGLPEVNHVDGNKRNNHASNLEWCTSSYNQIHAYKIGLQVHVRGSGHFASKIDERDVTEIRKMWATGKFKQYEIAKKFGIIQQNVSLICRGKAWTHVQK